MYEATLLILILFEEDQNFSQIGRCQRNRQGGAKRNLVLYHLWSLELLSWFANGIPKGPSMVYVIKLFGCEIGWI